MTDQHHQDDFPTFEEFCEQDELHFHTIRANTHSIVENALLRNRKLSWAARGLLVYMPTQDDDWGGEISDLEQLCSADDVQRIFDELKQHGYIYETIDEDGDTQLNYTGTPRE